MNKVINEQSNELCQEFGSLGQGGKKCSWLKKNPYPRDTKYCYRIVTQNKILPIITTPKIIIFPYQALLSLKNFTMKSISKK